MKCKLALVGIFIAGFATMLSAQSAMRGLHGDFGYMKKGLHAGNQIRCTFYNDGMLGTNAANPSGQGAIAGEWPINSGHIYIVDGNPFVVSEVIDANGEMKHISSTVQSYGQGGGSQGDTDPVTGEWWTFLPLPGFAKHPSDSLAMSKWPASWPATWPDKSDDPVDPGWAGKWNGYFGKGQMNADEEGFAVADDYNKKEFNFYPDSLDHSRKGLGLRMWYRSFQWSNALVQNVLFILYDIENIGTYYHDKMAFGWKLGNNMGDTMTASDGGADDCGAYTLEEDMSYMYDGDDIGGGGYTPVGYIGGAFLESPGNPSDGIDNDGDGKDGAGLPIQEDMFAPKVINAGDQIVLIDYKTFNRSVIPMPNDTLVVHYMDQVFKYFPGDTITEIQNNLVDDNLNGIIDENNGTEFGTAPNLGHRYLYTGLKYKNYLTTDGLDNKMIDERRDDGIDNDGDWNPQADDLGEDGAPFSKDPGEKDGKPTFGEPHFDKTDIHETDMIGLTSFNLYDWATFFQYDDEGVWTKCRPGKLDERMERVNVELLWGSGYFPMKQGDIQRFSMGMVLGKTYDELIANKKWMTTAYGENYNFSKAPNIPTVQAIPGNNRVVLYWDDYAEKSEDPITGKDFEGYRIYRSTSPNWTDMTPITSAYGEVIYRKPVAQFDLENGITGLSTVPVKGVCFDLGNDTGIRRYWTDTTAVNGYTYYYAVTSYDHGDAANGLPPTECSKFVSIGQNGKVQEKGSNVVVARPEAPSAGEVAGHNDALHLLPGGVTTGNVTLTLVDPTKINDGHVYHITFEDTLKVFANTPDTLYTKNLNLIDVTDPASPDTVVGGWKMAGLTDKFPLITGFELSFRNEVSLSIDTSLTKFNDSSIFLPNVAPYSNAKEKESPITRDMNIVFGDSAAVLDSSVVCIRKGKTLTAMGVNFSVLDAETGRKVPFGFTNTDGLDGQFSRTRLKQDEICILNSSTTDDTLRPSLLINLRRTTDDSTRRLPRVGDTLRVRLIKPFLSHDVFEFTMHGEKIDTMSAKASLADIKVVPNPYVVANGWEPTNPYSDGRGERQLHFIHLPSVCTIRVFNVRGQLVATIPHNTPSLSDGTEIWNMLSKDQLDISYGVYVYHVDAGTLGTKVGKFAVIK